jgi:hypothetical protein
MPGMFGEIIEIFFGCRHDKITRPITPVHRFGAASKTYVVCLGCGKQLHYDLTKMRVGKPMAAPEEPLTSSFLTSYK